MKRTAGLGFIFVTLLIDVLGIGLIVPILPKLIQSLAHGGVDVASREYGWLLSLYGAMQFLFSPLLGTLSDRFGRRPVLLLSLFFTGMDYVIMALAPTWPGCSSGGYCRGSRGRVTRRPAPTSRTSARRRSGRRTSGCSARRSASASSSARRRAACSASGGRVCPSGPPPGWPSPTWSTGCSSCRSRWPRNTGGAFGGRRRTRSARCSVLGRYPIVWGLTGALAAGSLALQCLQSSWVLWATARFGWDVRQNGLSLAAFGALSLIFQAGLSRVWLPKMGERRAVLLGYAIGSLEFLGYGLATHGWMVYAIMVAASLSYFAAPATQGLLSRQVGPDEQGTLQGALSSLTSLTAIFGPLLATHLFGWFTRPAAPVKVPGAPFLLGAALEALALVISVQGASEAGGAIRRGRPGENTAMHEGRPHRAAPTGADPVGATLRGCPFSAWLPSLAGILSPTRNLTHDRTSQRRRLAGVGRGGVRGGAGAGQADSAGHRRGLVPLVPRHGRRHPRRPRPHRHLQ